MAISVNVFDRHLVVEFIRYAYTWSAFALARGVRVVSWFWGHYLTLVGTVEPVALGAV